MSEFSVCPTFSQWKKTISYALLEELLKKTGTFKLNGSGMEVLRWSCSKTSGISGGAMLNELELTLHNFTQEEENANMSV